jgi:hypothetical protein
MSKLILVLNEKPEEPDLAAEELELAGYTVISVPKLSVAISWLRVNDPIMIVAPVHLMDDDVFDLLRFVRSDFQLKTTRILLYCVTPSQFTLGMRSTISSAALALGANGVYIGDSFDGIAFWKIVGPVLTGNGPQRTHKPTRTDQQLRSMNETTQDKG